MNAFLPLLIIIISFMLSASKNKNKKAVRKSVKTRTAASPAAGPKERPETSTLADEPIPMTELDVLPFETFDREGSIEMPPVEPQVHEGKPMPCPAEEREKPRPRPSQMAPEDKTVKRRELRLSFAGNSVMQSVVMAEILKRPEFKNGRRIIR